MGRNKEKAMKQTLRSACVLAAVLLAGNSVIFAQSPVGTTFTYQGQLKESGVPASGEYDFIFRLYNDPVAGAQVGIDLGIDDWLVTDGLFTVELDFGPDVFTGDALWLQVSVRPGYGGEYTDLFPRQAVNATPYALYALSSPGSGGYWAASGNDIYNNNSGNVGVGTGSPLDKLHVAGSAANLRLQDDDDPGSYLAIRDAGSAQACLEKYTSSGVTLLDFMPMPLDGISDASIRLFRSTNTTGLKRVLFYRGNNTTVTSAAIGVDGADSWFQAQGGSFGIGTTTPSAPLEVHNDASGQIVKLVSDQPYGYITFKEGSATRAYLGYGDAGHLLANALPDSFAIAGGAALHFAVGSDATKGITVDANGNVGIGTTTPAATLEIMSTTGAHGIRSTTTGIPMAAYRTSASGSWPAIHAESESSGSNATAVRAYLTSASPGAGSAAVVGQVNAASMNGYGVHGIHSGYGSGVLGESVNGIGVQARSASGWALYAETSGTTAARFVGNVEIVSPSSGTVLIEFGEGLDYAEGFDVADEDEIAPGTVLVIDVENAGKLAVSDAPYDHKVAGIVAGANGLGSAVRLGAGQYELDVALAGRVYCNVDASYGAIRPGDLLTTSPTPGYAMKVTDHGKAQGAVLGKAMQPLQQGHKGRILVLVTLQ